MSSRGFANSHKFRAWAKRHGDRLVAEGRRLEKDVEAILLRLETRGDITSFTVHPPYSQEDYAGRDFTARKQVDCVLVERSFGVTISPKSWRRAKQTHPATPQFCFPIGTNTDTIERRILGLFPKA